MNRIEKCFFCLLFAILCAGFSFFQCKSALADQEEEKNLVKNGSFEQGATGKFPEDWQVSMCADFAFHINGPSAKRARKRISVIDGHSHSGSQCVQFCDVNGGIKQYIPVEEGKVYVFSAWMKSRNLQGTGGIPILCWVGFRNLVGKTVKGGVNPDAQKVVGTTDWSLITVESKAPAGAIEAFITIFAHGSTGMVWIDDISFVAK